MTKNPVKYVTKQQLKDKAIGLSRFPSSTYSITELRAFWGKDAPIIKHGRYVYRVTQEVYDLF